jgi:Tfp pilus assembly protein PilO
MGSTNSDDVASNRSWFRFRFSLLALLILITLFCLGLGWWKYVYLERRQFIRHRAALAQRVQNLSAESKRKWEDYLDIAQGMENLDDGGQKALQQFDLKRLDRIDEQLMRLEGELWDLQAKKAITETDYHQQRIAQLIKQQEELKKRIERRGRQSADLEMRRADLERIHHMIDKYSEELDKLNIEAEIRGIPTK